MPPSPAMRYSPAREHRADNHKRGRSLEGVFKGKDDDLALFNEMQTRERENFLLQSCDDFDDTFSSKLRYFSDLKVGISIPARGESSELLNAEGDKNDYDWLLTPPDTPLFPSLDDEPPSVNVASRGRPQSQPITISRSSTMDKSYRSSKGSASPNRSITSPRSSSSTFRSRGRPSSAPHSSPTYSQRPATPSRLSSPPPSKPSTPAPRSSTPTPRRVSTGSTARGTSPVRTNRGNSASPKIRAWQSNIPGFSSEAPPNLRTSLADRPASYVRGSSPASRNGRDKFWRQSVSPTASRSVSSSYSQDRDRISSHSKGSVASSGDDDVDSLQSVHVGSLDHSASNRIGPFSNNRAPAFSKKSGRIISPSSAPKRSFDSTLRQMDHRKSPQNMFRPLLSSVPSSTFYVGKASSAHRSFISRNSSVTTSSNAVSDHCNSVSPDTEGSDLHQEDMASETGTLIYPDGQEEVFDFDKGDAFHRELRHDRGNDMLQIRRGDFDRDSAVECEPVNPEEFTHQHVDIEMSSASNTVFMETGLLDTDSLESTKICSRCGSRYHANKMVEKHVNLCPDCIRQETVVVATNIETTRIPAENIPVLSSMISETENRPSDESNPLKDASVSLIHMVEAGDSCHEDEAKQSQSMIRESEQGITRDGTGPSNFDDSLPGEGAKGLPVLDSSEHSGLNSIVSEGADGISLLLKRSSSSKGPFVQGRTFTASTIAYDDLSCTRNGFNSLRSSIGHGSTSASSSVDFSSGRHVETHVQRQLGGKKSDLENCRYDQNTRLQRTGSSLSGSLSDAHQALGLGTNTHEENIAGADKASMSSDAAFANTAVSNEPLFERNESSRTIDASTSDFPCHEVDIQLEEKSVVSNCDNPFLNEKGQDLRSAFDVGVSDNCLGISVEAEHIMQNTSLDGLDGDEVCSDRCLMSISEIEVNNPCESTLGLEKDDASTNSKGTATDFGDLSVPTPPEEELAASVSDHNAIERDCGIIESTVMVECRGGSKARNLTLEEATDTILFCSSIVHDLAYQAASIAIEKDSLVPLEASRPTVTILGRSTGDKKDAYGRITTGKRAFKSVNVRQRRVESEVKPPCSKTENDENVDESMVRNVGLGKEMDSMKPQKLESKCNCTIM